MTLSDIEWPFHASRAISAVAEFFVADAIEFNPNAIISCNIS